MSVKILWPPKDYTQLVALVRIIVKGGEKASMPVFQEQLGISKSTINRYLRVLREVFGVKIYFVRKNRTGYYVVEDYGAFNPEWFEQFQ